MEKLLYVRSDSHLIDEKQQLVNVIYYRAESANANKLMTGDLMMAGYMLENSDQDLNSHHLWEFWWVLLTTPYKVKTMKRFSFMHTNIPGNASKLWSGGTHNSFLNNRTLSCAVFSLAQKSQGRQTDVVTLLYVHLYIFFRLDSYLLSVYFGVFITQVKVDKTPRYTMYM